MHFNDKTVAISAFFILSLFLPVISFSQEIHDAVIAGDTCLINTFLDSDPGLIDLRNPDGMTPLCLAAYKNQPAVAALLIRRGADLLIGDIDNSQPLHCCGISGSVAIARMLVDKGVPVDCRDNNGMTALHFAVNRVKPEMVCFLADNGADLDAQSSRGYTPLFFGLVRDDSTMVKLLAGRGADVMARYRGMTYLHRMAYACKPAMIGLLFGLGLTDIDVKDDEGQTPLQGAARMGDLETVKFFVERGADVNSIDNYGWTPLRNAAFTNSAAVAYLIEKGADPSGGAISGLKTKPLHIATETCSLSIVRLLVENGAEVNVLNDRNQTPLYFAVRSGRQDIVEYLLGRGAAVNARESFLDRGLLHVCAVKGYGDIAGSLIKAGADPGVKDERGFTPSAYAAYHGFGDLNGLLPGARGINCSNSLLDKPLKSGEAAVWYLGHSGWAVRTCGHLLIFDYNFDQRCAVPALVSLASGHVAPAQLKGQAVTVLSSHEHGDHFSARCFEWQNGLSGITYVCGFGLRDTAQEYVRLDPDQTETVNGIEVSTIRSVDAGVAFLVKVDGLVIFHAGDHANANVEMTGQFPKDIDRFAADGVKIDLAFLGITGCSLGDPASVRKGVHYALEKLQPRALFPMHGGNRPDQYLSFADEAKGKKYKTKIMCATDNGDAFLYQNGTAGPFPVK